MNYFAYFAAQAVGWLYSSIAVLALYYRAATDGYITRRPTRGYWEEVERTRNRVWDLSKQPHAAYRHAFFTSKLTNLKIHYLTNDLNPEKPTKTNTLLIFIHGWPDTGLLWGRVTDFLPEADKSKTRLIAMDQPGFGGSDDLPRYGPKQLLEAIAEFILAMRQETLEESGPNHVIIAGHDWGAALAFRLASEAPQLADRFVISNGVIKAHAFENTARRAQTATKMLKGWIAKPTSFRLLRSAFSTIWPVLVQIRNSSYAILYNTPEPIPSIFLHLGHMWFPRFACCLAAGGREIQALVPLAPATINSLAAAAHLASPMGPNTSTINTKTSTGAGYPQTVQRRARKAGAAFKENIKIYSQGIVLKRWFKSDTLLTALHDLELASADKKRQSTGQAGGEEREGALRAPVTVIWGALDPALSMTICLEGTKDWFLVKNSQVVVFQDVGHWTPSDGDGPKLWAGILSWTINGEQEPLTVGDGAVITASV